MNLSVTLSGEPVTLKSGTFRLEDSIEERAVAELVLVDEGHTVHPRRGQRIKVTSGEGSGTVNSETITVDDAAATVDDTNVTVDGEGETVDGGQTVLFDGYVERPQVRYANDQKVFHEIEAVDHHYLVDKRLAAITYTGQTVEQIVTDLHSRYLSDEGIVVGNVDAGPVVDLIVFPYVPVSEALSELAELAGYWWWVSPGKVLQFRRRDTFEAPWTVGNADVLHVPEPTLDGFAPDYRNVQYVRNVRDLTDPQTERFRGDGDVRTFTVGFDIAETPTVTVNGSPQSVGIRGVDEGRQWYWNKGDKTVTQDSSETPLAASDVVQVVYVGQFDAVIISDNQDAIGDRKAVEGGTGRVEHVLNDRRVEGRSNAFKLASAKLDKYGQVGRTFQFTTRKPGLRPGMLLPVEFDRYQLDTSMLVVTVETSDHGGSELRWRVTAVEGPHSESWGRFFARMFDVPEVLVWSENTADVPILTRLFEFTKTWTDADTDPNIFRLVYPANDLAVSDTLFPQFDPDDRVRWVEVTHDGGTFRKVLTQTVGANTAGVVSTLYVGPNEANGDVTEVAWFGGTGAAATVGSGVEVGRLALVDVKTTAEAWSLVRTDTRDLSPDGWWLTGDVPEGVYG